MSIRLVESGWDQELLDAVGDGRRAVRIVCPFIKEAALLRILDGRSPQDLRVITRFNLDGFSSGVSDTQALRLILKRGGGVRGVRNLHSKLYLFGSDRAVVTSANLTLKALEKNHELGVVVEAPSLVQQCSDYFETLWSQAKSELNEETLEAWERKLGRVRSTGGVRGVLPDYGFDIGLPEESPTMSNRYEEAPQHYVKFLGNGDRREDLSWSTIDEIKRAGCHLQVSYPKGKRPTSLRDGAAVFIGRLTKEPNDIRIFGRAIGMSHVRGVDDASPGEITARPWREHWPHFVRVHHAEFVRGSMEVGVSLNELMDELQAHAFASTVRNLDRGVGNTDPRRAYRQQPAVRLAPQGAVWINERLEAAMARYGKLSPYELSQVGDPVAPEV